MRLPSPSEVFQEKYRIHQVIGKGGFATVYRATDEEVGRDVALKVLSPRDGSYPEAVVARFLREARLLAGLQDPHTITMYDFGRTEDGLLFMAFEYVSGLDLQEVLKRREKLPAQEVAHIIKQVLYALREAHDAGVFHRDIKPPNLLIYEYMGDPWCVKLLDFGVAKPVESHPMGPENLTREGAMVGTPRYMAPEQIYGRDLTPAADIYSLGLVAYEMLTGRPAMDAKTNKERVRQQLTGPQKLLPPDVGTPELRRVVNRMILRDPLARYQTASAALAALRQKPAVERAPASDRSSAERVIATSVPAFAPDAMRRIIAVGIGTALIGIITLVALRALRDDKPVHIGEDGVPRTGLQAVLRPSEPTENDAARSEPAKSAARNSGCDRKMPETGLHHRSAMVGLSSRKWAVYIPRNYETTRRHPVMLMFHNFLNEPKRFIDMTRMNEVADEKGFVILAPEAVESTALWDSVEDLEFIPTMLDNAKHELCLDTERVFALGHGRGGFFVRDLPCHMPLSGIATTGAGQRYGEQLCRAAKSVPTMRMFGLKDPMIPVGGGTGCLGGEYVASKTIDNEHVAHFECVPDAEPWLKSAGGACASWSCPNDASYVSCALDGGHSWPGGSSSILAPTCVSSAPDFPMHRAIWRFFEEEGRELP